MSAWELHKPGVHRLYGEGVRAVVYRSDVRGGWAWVIHTIDGRSHTHEVAVGRCKTRRLAMAAGEALVRVYGRAKSEAVPSDKRTASDPCSRCAEMD